MSNFKLSSNLMVVITGEQKYSDDEAVRSLVSYMVKSPNRNYIVGANLPLLPMNDLNAWVTDISQFITGVQNLYGGVKTRKMVHIVLALDKSEKLIFDDALEELSCWIANYYGEKGYQILVDYHLSSRRKTFYPHIHIMMSRINVSGKKFYADNNDFNAFAKDLEKHTGEHFSVEYRSSGSESF